MGDLERLQEIQRKRDITNRDWQRIILRNVGKSFGWEMDGSGISAGPRVVETRQLWWQVFNKRQNPDYRNMLLLIKMEELLEQLMIDRKQKYITQTSYEKIVSHKDFVWDCGPCS